MVYTDISYKSLKTNNNKVPVKLFSLFSTLVFNNSLTRKMANEFSSIRLVEKKRILSSAKFLSIEIFLWSFYTDVS